MAKSDGIADGEKKSKKRKHAIVVVHQQDKNDDESAKPTKSGKKAKDVVGNDSQDNDGATQPKRRKTEKESTKQVVGEADGVNNEELDTTKPSAVFTPVTGREHTLSIAIPGSFIANTLSFDQKSDLASRIARAAAVFCVDEIVVFDDEPGIFPDYLQSYRVGKNARKSKAELQEGLPQGDEAWKNPDQFLFHVLSFLECPGQLRQYLFPMHPNLANTGKMPTLDMPHHMRSQEWCQYREGASLDLSSDSIPGQRGRSDILSMDAEESALIDCGLPHPIKLNYAIAPHSRVTLRFASPSPPPSWPHLSAKQVASLEVDAVTTETPRVEGGYYWGYTTRRAGSLSEVFTDCPFDGGYDYSIGTSERGVALTEVLPESQSKSTKSARESNRKLAGGPNKLPEKFKHLLLVFGGVTGLEPAVACDPMFKEKGITKETAHEVFDAWVNLVPGQGSRTIRLEEAVWLGLMGFRGYVDSQAKAK